MDDICLCPHLLATCQTVFEQGTCCLQFATFQVHESQQTEWGGTIEGAVQFAEVCQALLSQLSSEYLILLPDKEQVRLQAAHPAKAHPISQRLVERKTLFQQCPRSLVLPLFGSGTCPFGRARALPPAVAEFLEAGRGLLQARMGQGKLTPDASD